MTENQYYIIRSEAGTYCAQIKERRDREATIVNARKLWYWNGATSTAQISQEGVKNPGSCKFTMIIPELVIMGIYEILPCTDEALENIRAVHEWKA